MSLKLFNQYKYLTRAAYRQFGKGATFWPTRYSRNVYGRPITYDVYSKEITRRRSRDRIMHKRAFTLAERDWKRRKNSRTIWKSKL